MKVRLCKKCNKSLNISKFAKYKSKSKKGEKTLVRHICNSCIYMNKKDKKEKMLNRSIKINEIKKNIEELKQLSSEKIEKISFLIDELN